MTCPDVDNYGIRYGSKFFAAHQTWAYDIFGMYRYSQEIFQVAKFRRGFVDQLHCTLSEFMQHAQDLALRHPVRKWVLTDFKPWDTNKRFLVWGHELPYDEQELNHGPKYGDLPNPLFQMLRKGKSISSSSSARGYESKEDVIEDIQNACYHYARQKLLATSLTQEPSPIV
jgi:hypothetical protein